MRNPSNNNRRVKGYPFDPVRPRKEIILKTYEYDIPFNFPNITVYRKDYDGGEFHGVELIPNNDAFHVEKLGSVAPHEWVRMQFDVIVPPGAVEGAFRLDVADMAANETLQTADAFTAVVRDGWSKQAPIPKGAKNLLGNPDFTGSKMPPSGWELVREGRGQAEFPHRGYASQRRHHDFRVDPRRRATRTCCSTYPRTRIATAQIWRSSRAWLQEKERNETIHRQSHHRNRQRGLCRRRLQAAAVRTLDGR